MSWLAIGLLSSAVYRFNFGLVGIDIEIGFYFTLSSVACQDSALASSDTPEILMLFLRLWFSKWSALSAISENSFDRLSIWVSIASLLCNLIFASSMYLCECSRLRFKSQTSLVSLSNLSLKLVARVETRVLKLLSCTLRSS